MAQYYYFNESGEKIGPVSGREIKSLAEQGIITQETALETDTGHKGLAKQIQGLFPIPPPLRATMSVPHVQVPPIIERNPFIGTTPSFDDSAMNNMGMMFGKVLASGSGKGNSTIFKTWRIMIVIMIFSVISMMVICSMALQDIRQNPLNHITMDSGLAISTTDGAVKSVLLIGFLTCVVICGLLIPYTIFHCKGIEKTNITVYENGIIGTGCGKYFDVNFDLHDFQLTFDKIMSVDKDKIAIIIHAGAQYKCYVANPVEIQALIVRQQQNLRRVL